MTQDCLYSVFCPLRQLHAFVAIVAPEPLAAAPPALAARGQRGGRKLRVDLLR